MNDCKTMLPNSPDPVKKNKMVQIDLIKNLHTLGLINVVAKHHRWRQLVKIISMLKEDKVVRSYRDAESIH